jgi:hypothetical protein
MERYTQRTPQKSDKMKEAVKKIIDKHLSNDSDKGGDNNIAADQQQTIGP